MNLWGAGGIGSQIHVYGKGLAIAMALGRVYIQAWGPSTLFTEGAFCPERSTLDQCFFRPLTKCTLEHTG